MRLKGSDSRLLWYARMAGQQQTAVGGYIEKKTASAILEDKDSRAITGAKIARRAIDKEDFDAEPVADLADQRRAGHAGCVVAKGSLVIARASETRGKAPEVGGGMSGFSGRAQAGSGRGGDVSGGHEGSVPERFRPIMVNGP
jgi:hypothetical protein